MAWKGSVEEQRAEFLAEFTAPGANRRAVCRAWGVSAKTAYKWLARGREEGEAALRDRSRRPGHSPSRTDERMEARIVEVRRRHPAWGGRKIAALLEREGVDGVPHPSTITGVLRRAGCLGEVVKRAWKVERFEREKPNELWQMDFKGHFAVGDGTRCHPLLVLDDHSRYCVGAEACQDERSGTVEAALTGIFRRYGLPESMLMDNGAPWGRDPRQGHTRLELWLIRLGIVVLHGRPRHPQTQGKLERLNRTLGAEVLAGCGSVASCAAMQPELDRWRPVYNGVRPHEALEMQVPASRYEASGRALPGKLPPIEYEEGDAVRRVQKGGWINYRGREYRLSRGLAGSPVAIRPSEGEAEAAVYFCSARIALLDERTGQTRPWRK